MMEAPALYPVLLTYTGIPAAFVGFTRWLLLKQRVVELRYDAQNNVEILRRIIVTFHAPTPLSREGHVSISLHIEHH